MHQYVTRANVDHYLSLLNGGDLSSRHRGTVTQLLLAEEDNLGNDLEHLEFAEIRAARGRERVNHVRNLREEFAYGTSEREQAAGELRKPANAAGRSLPPLALPYPLTWHLSRSSTV